MMTPHLPTPGERMNYLRGLRGLMAHDVARAADISTVRYRLYEFNLRTPTPEHVERLAHALRTSAAFLLTGDLGTVKHFLTLQSPRMLAVGGIIRQAGRTRTFTEYAETR